MCGICGLISHNHLTVSQTDAVTAMNEALFHRGPDDTGEYRDSALILRMRRLSIIDLEHGHQPLFNEDKTIALVANGEIYNYIEIANELKKSGHNLRTGSDCETIIHLYEEYGIEGCLKKLRGMYAFALYDKRKQQIFIARDRLSEKPLYYHRTGNELVFSSEMKSLLVCLRPKGLKINNDAVNLYFHYQYVPEPLTCVEGVHKLPAAHYMTVSLRDFSFSLKKYWDIEAAEPVRGNPEELIREAFDNLSKYIIRADVPVGVALSGGIDSSAIAVFGAKYYREQMHAFSIGYPGRPDNDERQMAKSLADKLGIIHHEVELKTKDMVDSFPDLVYGMDDPIADIAAFGYYSVNKLARQHNIPVLLSGLGGDELFWGYKWVRNAVQKNLVKRELQSGLGNHSIRWPSFYNTVRKIKIEQMLLNPVGTTKRIISNTKMEQAKFLDNSNRFIFTDERKDFIDALNFSARLYADEFQQQISKDLPYSFFTDDDWEEVPVKICKFLFQTWLYSNCVVLGDRMSMCSSIEIRLPFLDYQLVELVMGLRKTYRDDYTLGYKKWFIDAMENVIPREVLEREKMGFNPPVKEWYKAIVSRYGKLCYGGYLVSNRIIKKDRLGDFIGDKINKNGNLFFSYKIVLLELWCRKFMLGEA